MHDVDEELEEYHVVPIGDLKDHVCSEHCWCEPKMDPDGDGLIYIHNSLDGRERQVH